MTGQHPDSFTFVRVKKNGSRIIVLLFSVVLAGILLIQAWWVKSILEIRSQQFENAVVQALRSTSGKLELKENVTIIRQSMEPSVRKARAKKPAKKNTHREVHVVSGSNVLIDKKGKAVTNSYSYTMDDDSVKVKINAGNGAGHSSSTFVFNTADDTALEIGELKEPDAVDKKISDIKLLIHKMVLSEKDSSQLFPKGPEISKNMKVSLDENNLDLPFAIGILLSGKKYYLSPGADSVSVFSSAYKTDLFPDDILKRKAELFITFPGKRSHLLSEIIWILVLVLLFTAVLVYLFVYTLINYNRQKKLNQLKSDFINNMTHELKTPLATIQLASDVILKKDDDPASSISHMAVTIKTQSKKIDEDVRNMLQIALLENSGESILNYSVFNLHTLLSGCIHKLQLIAAQKNIHLELRCDQTLQLEADADLLQKAVGNLADNAIKYSYERGTVIIEAAQHNKELILRVSDNGSGIQPADMPHVFGKFYKAGKGNIHYNKGYGLGLSFVKKITELHGGSAQAYSVPGKETIFMIRIPIRK